MSTANLELPTSPSGPSNISVAFNDAMQRIDGLVQLIIEDNTLNDPPVTVSGDEGKRWIVASVPTGDWVGHTNDVALCTAPGLWKYLSPKNGWRGRVLVDGLYYIFDGSSWNVDPGVTAAFSDLVGSPSDNAALATVLADKADDADLVGLATETYVNEAVNAAHGTLAGLNDQTGTSYTLVASDAGKEVRCTNAAAVAFNIDTQANVPVDEGFWCLVSQGGAGTVTVTALAGVTLHTPNGATTSMQYDARGVQRINGDEWRVW